MVLVFFFFELSELCFDYIDFLLEILDVKKRVIYVGDGSPVPILKGLKLYVFGGWRKLVPYDCLVNNDV